MKPRVALKSLLLTTAIGLCLSAAQAGAAPSTASTASQSTAVAVPSAAQEEQWLSRLEKILAAVPADVLAEVQSRQALLGYRDTLWSRIANSAIDPNDYECSRTPMSYWIEEQVKDWDEGLVAILFSTGINWLPFADAFYFGTESRSNQFGVDGQYTHLLTSEMQDLKRFWDIYSADIRALPMHSADVFSSVDRIARAYQAVGYDPASAQELAAFAYEWVRSEPRVQGGAHPMFSFNAMAVSGATDAAGNPMPDSIIMGDGVLQAMAGLGIDTEASRAILAHEFGHQVQYENGLLDDGAPQNPEGTRRVELMADSLATYYLTHARGEALNAKRLLPTMRAFYEVGDCGFASRSHHGTPNQRMRASGWAAEVANDAQKQGHVTPSMVFIADFDRKLPELVAPDAP